MTVTKAQLVAPVGVVTASGLSVSGVVTATSFSGDGSGLTGVGIGTTGNVNTTGIITASSFVGNVTGNATGLSGSPNVVLGITTVGSATSQSVLITSLGFVGLGSTAPRVSLDASQKTDAIFIPIGTTGQRPSSSQRGMVRYNTSVNAYEVFDGTFWTLISIGKYTEGLEYLVVAGGGGGGVQAGWYGSGGGGAGGVLNGFTSLPLNIAIPIVVGAGGAGGSGTNGQTGNNSVLGTLIAYGGGFGSGQSGSWPFSNGGPGGSGGGASSIGALPGTGVIGQGNPGGDCYSTNTNTTAAGGGGGAGTAGKSNLSVDSNIGGSGGSGIVTNISGSYVAYGGGGGGGRSITGGTFGIGGAGGGGGAGLNTSGTLVQNGTANTGGGGGGSRETTGGNGGSGVIIIKIPNAFTATFSGGVTSSLSTAVSGFKIYTITATSTTNETVTFS